MDEASRRIVLEYFRSRQRSVQPADPAQKVSGDHVGRGGRSKANAEILSPDSVGKPPAPKVEYVSFPTFMGFGPDGMRDALRNDGIRIRIHPEDFKRLPEEVRELIGSEGANPSSKFLVWEDTGRKVDRLA